MGSQGALRESYKSKVVAPSKANHKELDVAGQKAEAANEYKFRLDAGEKGSMQVAMIQPPMASNGPCD